MRGMRLTSGVLFGFSLVHREIYGFVWKTFPASILAKIPSKSAGKLCTTVLDRTRHPLGHAQSVQDAKEQQEVGC